MRRRLCRQHQGRALAPDSPLGPRPPHQPRTPRRLRIRSGHRRRRRHPDPDAGSVLPQDACSFALPPAGSYGAGLVFLPHDADSASAPARRSSSASSAKRARRCSAGAKCRSTCRRSARARRRLRRSSNRCSSGRDPGAGSSPDAFERKLYVIRKLIERATKDLYICGLSSKTLIYKGMLTASQIEGMFPDLSDADVESALALVHQRFSTNTFPSWPLAHPYRFVAHNGEINTLRGNINWMKAREGLLKSSVFGDDLQKVLPVIAPGGSDTATFDNVLEFLVMAGRSLPHAVLMMIPEPWVGQPGDGSGGARVLRIPLVADGAVGRSGVDHLHRRPPDRRRARSQRPAPVALLHHEGRPGDHGVGSRRPRHPRRAHRRQGSPAPRQDAADRHRRRPHHQRHRDQADARRRASVRRVAAPASRRHREPAERATPSVRIIRPCCAASRRSATRRKICGCC